MCMFYHASVPFTKPLARMLLCVLEARLDLIDSEQWGAELETMRRLQTERDEICRDELKASASSGKKILHTVFNGGAPPAQLSANEFLLSVAALGRLFR